MSLSHTLQKSLHAAVDWFPISTLECIGLMLNPKTNAYKAGAIGLVSIKYDDQIHSTANMEANQLQQAISLAVKNRIANEIEGYIFTSLTQMTARLICVLAAIFNLRFSRIKQHFHVFKGKYCSIAVKNGLHS